MHSGYAWYFRARQRHPQAHGRPPLPAPQIADALASLHESRYVHGDVTSDNVFIEDHRHLAAAAVVLGDLKPHRWVRITHGCFMVAWHTS